MSYADCIRIRVSIFTPNAFSMRSAISPERLAFPFNKLESAGRDTPSAIAAAVTDNPVGSTISVRMKSPGCGGFFRGISVSIHLMVVFKIQFVDILGKSVIGIGAARRMKPCRKLLDKERH